MNPDPLQRADLPTSFISKQVILHVEDSAVDHEALKRAFHKVGVKVPLFWCTDAQDALQFLAQLGRYEGNAIPAPRPSLILLDLNMPAEDGRSFLRQLRATPEHSSIPVIIFSSSANEKDVEECFKQGANAYLLKPMNSADLQSLVLAFSNFWLKHSVLPHSSQKKTGPSDSENTRNQ